MKNPSAVMMIFGALLSIPAIALIMTIDDNNIRRRLLPFAIAGVLFLVIGIAQYLSYALRPKQGKAAYREKWRARGLYHALLTTAISSGSLTNSDLEHIKSVYNKSTGLTLGNDEILEIAKRMSNFPGNFSRDMKAYANRIKKEARENIISQCIIFAIEKEAINETHEALQRITVCLYIEPEFLALKTKQMLKRERLGISLLKQDRQI